MANKHDYHWTFGNGAHIRFPNGGDPVADAPHAFNTLEGCASFSDSNGNLLFYTDGDTLCDGAHTLVGSGLGGTNSSANAAIIVPPAGGGALYHIFTTADWDGKGQPHVGPVTYTAIAVGTGIAIASGPTKLTGFGPQRAAEKLAAVSHKDCRKYWVVSLDIDKPPGPGSIFAMRIDSDVGPTAGNTVSQVYPYPPAVGYYCVKFSPAGDLLAISSFDRIDILNFDRSTGAFTPHSQVTTFPAGMEVYGLEFSPDGLKLYLTGLRDGYLNRHTIGASGSGPTPFASTDSIAKVLTSDGVYYVGALQLGPNGKIYGAEVGQAALLEIADPNNPVAAAVQCNMIATAAGGGPLTLVGNGRLGLPTFTRMTDDCDDRCRELADKVDATLAEQGAALYNHMRPCKGDDLPKPDCHPLDISRIAPWTSIRWGDSKCDCIEGDDIEIMYLTVCNPYSNLTLSNLTVYELVVVDAKGNPVPNLPDGTASIQLVPIGPYCFDDIPPCSCVTREFMLRLRGAPGGSYHILVKGICFDACFHGDTEACFTFEVCKD